MEDEIRTVFSGHTGYSYTSVLGDLAAAFFSVSFFFFGGGGAASLLFNKPPPPHHRQGVCSLVYESWRPLQLRYTEGSRLSLQLRSKTREQVTAREGGREGWGEG